MIGHIGLSAITLSTADMARAVRFYETLGFRLSFGGPEADFTTLWAGPSALNLTTERGEAPPGFWGRVIFEVEDVDAFHTTITEAGIETEFPPRDAPWMERYFHLHDPDGHELSFMTPIRDPS
ncbi:VOC family protein [Henriciella aquimarina]|uniref:VOC family protein n=1 Tax=Henriciella aquimarina TaxID=545261 RepID=UPI001F26FA79|nr:VOC family protein [Henriciella aquimarina]